MAARGSLNNPVEGVTVAYEARPAAKALGPLEGVIVSAAERDVDARVRAAREKHAAERFFGWMANYGCCVSKAEGERRRREALEQARQRQAEIARELARLEAKFPHLKAQYEDARNNGAPNDTVRDARRSPPPPAERELRSALQGGEGRQDRGRPSLHRYGSQR